MKITKKHTVFIFIIVTTLIVLFYNNIFGAKEMMESGQYKKIIMFYMPGCIHCNNLMPAWDKVEAEYRGNKEIKLESMNGTSSPEIASFYGVNSFPTIVFIKNSKVIGTYKGNRTYEDLKRFVRESINY